jgi:hypothetical protein
MGITQSAPTNHLSCKAQTKLSGRINCKMMDKSQFYKAKKKKKMTKTSIQKNNKYLNIF